MPLTELGILGTLARDLVLDDLIAEVINDGRDGEHTAEPFVQGLLCHGFLLHRFAGSSRHIPAGLPDVRSELGYTAVAGHPCGWHLRLAQSDQAPREIEQSR